MYFAPKKQTPKNGMLVDLISSSIVLSVLSPPTRASALSCGVDNSQFGSPYTYEYVFMERTLRTRPSSTHVLAQKCPLPPSPPSCPRRKFLFVRSRKCLSVFLLFSAGAVCARSGCHGGAAGTALHSGPRAHHGFRSRHAQVKNLHLSPLSHTACASAHARQGHIAPKWASYMYVYGCVHTEVHVCYHGHGWVPTPIMRWYMVRNAVKAVRDALAHAVWPRGHCPSEPEHHGAQ